MIRAGGPRLASNKISGGASALRVCGKHGPCVVNIDFLGYIEGCRTLLTGHLTHTSYVIHKMGTQVNFDINDALKQYLSDPATIATPEADGALVDCEADPESLTSSLINGILNPIIDAIAENPDALARSSIFDSLQFLLKCAPIFLQSEHSFPSEPASELFSRTRFSQFLHPQILSKLFDLITSGLSAEFDIVHHELETEDQDAFLHHRKLLEMYGFLLQWVTSAVEIKAAEKSSAPPAKGRGTGKVTKAKAGGKEGVWDSLPQLQTALDTMCKGLKSKLGKIFVTTSERETFVGLFTRPVYLILESEHRVKSTPLRMHAFKVLCIAIKHHGHAFGTFDPSYRDFASADKQ